MLTQKILKELVNYNPDTGAFKWMQAAMLISGRSKGPGRIDTHGYLQISVNGKRHLAHRLAWLYVYGEWPNQIDHINGDRLDNRIPNLRDVNSLENAKNQKKYKNNKSGVIGVGWNKRACKWRARITVDGYTKELGSFSKKEDAKKARSKAEKELNFHENHGRTK